MQLIADITGLAGPATMNQPVCPVFPAGLSRLSSLPTQIWSVHQRDLSPLTLPLVGAPRAAPPGPQLRHYALITPPVPPIHLHLSETPAPPAAMRRDAARCAAFVAVVDRSRFLMVHAAVGGGVGGGEGRVRPSQLIARLIILFVSWGPMVSN